MITITLYWWMIPLCIFLFCSGFSLYLYLKIDSFDFITPIISGCIFISGIIISMSIVLTKLFL
jgi:hypothetical protein